MRRLLTAAILTLSFGCASAASQMEEFARTLHPSDFPLQIEKLLQNERPAQALELAELGLEKSPKSAQLRFMKAVSLETLGRTDEAVRELRGIIAAFPEIPEPYNNLAVIEAKLGQLEEAEELLHKALLINPEFALARKNLGDVYLALARECYEAAQPKLPRNSALKTRLDALKRLEAAAR